MQTPYTKASLATMKDTTEVSLMDFLALKKTLCWWLRVWYEVHLIRYTRPTRIEYHDYYRVALSGCQYSEYFDVLTSRLSSNLFTNEINSNWELWLFFSYYTNPCKFDWLIIFLLYQWRIRKFKNGGGGIIIVFEVWRLFWCPFTHIPYAFVVRVENKMHIVKLHVNYSKV